jgi:hypothetical protein
MGKHRGLPLETEDGAVDIGLSGQHTGIVDEVAGREVIRAIGDQIVLADDVERVLRGEPGPVRFHLDVGVHTADALDRTIELGAADAGGVM